MKPKPLNSLLEQEGFVNEEKFAEKKRKALTIIKTTGLNLDLIKGGSSWVLSFFIG